MFGRESIYKTIVKYEKRRRLEEEIEEYGLLIQGLFLAAILGLVLFFLINFFIPSAVAGGVIVRGLFFLLWILGEGAVFGGLFMYRRGYVSGDELMSMAWRLNFMVVVALFLSVIIEVAYLPELLEVM